MFKAVEKPIVGLDVGSSAVKMVSLGTNGDGGCHVIAAAMSTIDSIDGREPSEIAEMAAIEDCLKASQGSISRDSYFVLGLSGSKNVKISSFNFTLLTLEEVAQAVMLEAAQVCPFDIKTSVVDYQLIGTYEADGGGLRKKEKKVQPSVKGILAVATRDAIFKRRKLAEDALLKCVLIDSDELAILNCLEKCLPSGEELPITVVNVGRSLTNIAILGTDGLPFVRNLGYSGGDIIDFIAKSSNTSAEQVQQRLSESKGSADIDLACKKLIVDITETLAYYLASHGGNAIKHVYVCGGFSLFDDFVKSLAGGIDGKVSVWNPFLQMHCDDNIAGGDLIKKCGPAFAVAAGLAMRQV